jgi:peptidoglycan/LPS O-acetylase OafA/YrhL
MKILYRPEIDGLRAVSVFAVIIYHANFILFGHNLFQGGFIGVDIFFVISGYLITTLILKEIYKTNQFSFKHFYERRIRRILPILLFVTIITSVISYFILLPLSLMDFGKSVLSIISFSSNFYFWSNGRKYGEESELTKPLLHTWSLSVEEQFYILFPVFLIVIIKFFKKHLVAVLFLSFLISLLFSEYFSKTHPSFNFYIILSRVFELIIGSILSYLELNNGRHRKPYSILNKICPSLGIILIAYSFLFFNFTKIFHPSFITLIPVIGVSLIIWFAKKKEPITEILSSRIFVFFGLISYSLYLWHYPIFAFLRYIEIFNNRIQIKIFAIILTIILSILSWHSIERPFRNKNIVSIKTLVTYISISVIILLSYNFYILNTKGIKSRFPNLNSEELSYNLNNNLLNQKTGEHKKLLMIGDSHSDSLKYYLNEELIKESYNFYKKDSSLYLQNFNKITRKTGIEDKAYIESTKEIDRFIEQHQNLIVVWHQRWSMWLSEEYFDNQEGYTEYQNIEDREHEAYFQPIGIRTKTLEERQNYIIEGIKSSVKNILKEGNALILVYPTPELGFDVRKLLLKENLTNLDKIKTRNKKMYFPILSVSYNVYKERNKMIFETLDSIQGANIYRVYPHKSFCNTVIKERCVANNKEHLFYYDDDHLSLQGSKYIINDIMKIIQKIQFNNKINK